jgi:RimJ/RimL family protein N-acetyltransferase
MPETKNTLPSCENEARYLNECKEDPEGYYWSIVWKETGKLIGTISITDINTHHGIGELGIVIGEKEYWGKGVAQEAIKDIFEFVSSIGLRRIGAEFEEGNLGMEKVLLKIGFQKESSPIASRIKDGKYINTERYVMFL